MAKYEWWVPGVPKAQGSMTAMTNPKTGKAFVKQPKNMLEWRKWVMTLVKGDVPEPLTGAQITLVFFLPRPKSHPKYTHKSPWVFRKPDIDKLVRAVLDALTYAGALKDDAVVVSLCARKMYADKQPDGLPGVQIYLDPIAPPTKENP